MVGYAALRVPKTNYFLTFQNISQILYGFYKFTVLRNKITSTFSTYNKKYAV